MAFSELLQHVGNFGRFQIMISILSILLSSLITTHNLVQNFSAAIPAHRCYTQLLDNTTSKTKITMNLTDKDLLKISIPMGPNQKQEQCHRFRQTQWQLLNPNESAPNTTELEIEPCLDGWTYDRSVFTSTVVTQWDLVCDSWALKSLAQGIFALGYVVGSPISGFIADRLGRKPVLLTSSLLVGLLGICSVSAPTFSVYCTLRFFTAMSLAAMNLSSLALLVEWIPTSSRPIVMTVWALSFSTGQVLLGGLAYVFRDWHTLQLSISVPYLLFFLFLWKSSESARWLIVSGQLDKALKTLKDIAHFNGRQDAAESLNCEILQSAMQEELTFLKHGSKTMKIVTNPSMLKITCCLCFIRFVIYVNSLTFRDFYQDHASFMVHVSSVNLDFYSMMKQMIKS
ncbi:steroid transmembrane transporter SLC22A24-like [Loxodonta africana]|uniref:steroid transmembrane transporter SLC22A24-like n=1 Tax=Loxodonta africana TaxID=9785 RepID=UPI0005404D27|nr:solute carrier family 22 member 24-like [Loxodonta africana]